MKRMISLASVLVLTGLWVRADDKPIAPARSPDEQFLFQAVASGVLEVRLGQLAVERADDSEVKKFGQRMIDDHSKANKELLTIRGARRVELPELEIMPKEKALMQKLSGLKGTDFDRQYIQHMVAGHQEAVQIFEKAIRDGKNEAIKTFAEKSLPTIKEHLKKAKELEATLRVGQEPKER